MNSELYTAASGLLVEERRLELIANNLANAATTGFRAQRAFASVFQHFGPGATENVRTANAGVALAGAYDLPGPGPLRPTGDPLDVALADGQFLAVETAAGRRYTRSGELSIDASGFLVITQGHRVLGNTGQPLARLGPDAAIAPDGRVLNGGAEVGRLMVLADPGNALVREGSNLLRAEEGSAALVAVQSPELKPGHLEGSATDPVAELVQMIEAQRAFESYQKLVSETMNNVNKKAVNDLAG